MVHCYGRRTMVAPLAELQRDVRATIAKLLYSASGDVPHRAGAGGGSDISMVSHGGGFLARMPRMFLAWLSDADLDFYAGEFARTGFRGGLNWFRNVDRNWDLLAPFAGAKVTVPALYMASEDALERARRDVHLSTSSHSRLSRTRTRRAARLRSWLPRISTGMLRSRSVEIRFQSLAS